MLKTKPDNEAIDIPVKIAERLELKDGAIIEARAEKGKLLIIRKKNRITKTI